MGNESFMSCFQEDHVEAFDPFRRQQPKLESIHLFNGLPQEGNYGLYSTRVSYKEWHHLACVRKSYNEICEDNTSVVVQLLIGSMVHPWPAISTAFVYLASTIGRSCKLYQENGIQKANDSWYSTLRDSSKAVMAIIALTATVAKLDEQYDLKGTILTCFKRSAAQ